MTGKIMSFIDILKVPMKENDANAETIGHYLKTLLIAVLEEQEGFSGKRPFGNSGWFRDLVEPLVLAKKIEGRYDEEFDSIDDFNEDEAVAVLIEAIEDLFDQVTP